MMGINLGRLCVTSLLVNIFKFQDILKNSMGHIINKENPGGRWRGLVWPIINQSLMPFFPFPSNLHIGFFLKEGHSFFKKELLYSIPFGVAIWLQYFSFLSCRFLVAINGSSFIYPVLILII